MLFTRAALRRLLLRATVLWLLIAVVALQGISISFSAARGPAHVHRESVRVLALEDVRRSNHSASQGQFALGWSGHSHQASLRHHHAAADQSVLLEPENAALAAAEDGTLAHDLAVVAFVAVLLPGFTWAPAALSQQRALRTSWQPSFVTARLLERPPQAV